MNLCQWGKSPCLWGNIFTWLPNAEDGSRLIYPGCTCLVNLGAGTLSQRRPPAAVFCRKSGEVLHMEGIIHDYSSINRRRGWKRICGRTPSHPPPLLCLRSFPVFSDWFSHVCVAAVVQHHGVIRVQPVAELQSLLKRLHSLWNLSSGDMSCVHMTWCITTFHNIRRIEISIIASVLRHVVLDHSLKWGPTVIKESSPVCVI